MSNVVESGRAFLDVILANPEDAALRLIYADWLEEHGEAVRAAFIRADVECHQLEKHDHSWSSIPESENNRAPDCPQCCCLWDLTSECLALLEGNGHWFIVAGRAPAPDLTLSPRWSSSSGGTSLPPLNDSIEGKIQRGFLGALCCSAEDWIACGDGILQDHPIQSVELTTLPILYRVQGEDGARFTTRSGTEPREMFDDASHAAVVEALSYDWPAINFEPGDQP